ncbi:MAG: hypothetical protein ACRD1R_00845 [Acidobacteriota bacterium]
MRQPWAFGLRLVSNQIPRASVRTTFTYQFLTGLSAGIEYNPRAGKVSPLANWLAIPETERRPALMLGTSSDRIGTPSGQSFYATVSKNLQRELKLPIAPYAGLAYGTYEDRLRPIGGLSVGFTERLSALVIFDGVHIHPTLNLSLRQHHFSLLLIRGRDPGISYSVIF